MSVLRKLVDERLVLAIILINALALFLGGYEEATARHAVWFAVDYACVLYFVIETVLKIILAGWRGYWSHNWNRMDFVIIAVSAPVLITPVVDLHWMSSLTAIRLLRLFRLFRLFRFIPGREHMAKGIARSLKASVGVFLGVVLVNVIMALGAVVLFSASPEDPYFGNPWRACYSMFQVFTVEGWYEIPNHIAATSSDARGVFARIYFVIAVFGGGILGLSLVNAVFVDQMTVDNTDPLEERIEGLSEEIRLLREEIRALRGDRAASAPARGADIEPDN